MRLFRRNREPRGRRRPARRRVRLEHAHQARTSKAKVRVGVDVACKRTASMADGSADGSKRPVFQRLWDARRRDTGPESAWRCVDQVCDAKDEGNASPRRGRGAPRADWSRETTPWRIAVSQGRWGTVRVWRWRTDGTLEPAWNDAIRAGSGFCKMAASGRERHVRLALPGENTGTIDVWDLDGRVKTCTIRGGTTATDRGAGGAGMCMSVQWLVRNDNPDVSTDLIMGTYEDGSVQVWDTRNASQPIARENWHDEAVVASDHESKKGIVVTGSATGELVLARWNPADASFAHPVKLKLEEKGIADVSIRPDRKVVAVGSWSGKVHFCALKRPQLLSSLSYHTESVNSVCYSPDGKVLASTSNDCTVALWSMYNATAR